MFSPITDLTLSSATYETRGNLWLRPSTVSSPACLLPAFTSVTTKCCWTTHSSMLSVRQPRASISALTCGWGCHMGSPRDLDTSQSSRTQSVAYALNNNHDQGHGISPLADKARDVINWYFAKFQS